MVWPMVLFFVLTVPVLLYTMTIVLFTIVIFSKKNDSHMPHCQPVSVIIPFRDEVHNIPPLIQSLGAQIYPEEFELILIDDNSSDRGREVADRIARELTVKTRVESLKIDPAKNLTSKQQALDYGVKLARYPLVVFTDADMIFDQVWLKDLAGSLTQDLDLVFGHTSVIKRKSRSLFELLESFQLELLFCFALAFDKANLCGSGMGNNIAFRKENYTRCGGQSAIGYSIVEDRGLMALFKKNGCNTASQSPFTPKAYTYPCSDLRQFSNQLRRWASGGLSAQSNLVPFALLFFIQNTLLLLTPMGILPTLLFWPLLMNFFLTWLFAALCFKKSGSKESALLFPLYYIFLIVETVLWGISILLRQKVRWKERTL